MNSSEYEDCGLLWIKQTDGQGQCFEYQYEALQISRKNCQALIKAGKNVGEGA